jgi:phosphoserine phosphatase
MNISFDLDSTIIPNGDEFKTETIGWIGKLFKVEKIRKGSKDLILKLQNDGHKVNIYTTSFRSKSRIRRTLKYYGISVNRIVNQTENQKILKSKNIYSTKYPPAFNFDVHIDDLPGVKIEGEKYNFKTIIIHPSDKNWADIIINELKTI